MSTTDDDVRIDLDDRIWAIEGTYCGKEEAPGYDHDEPLYYIKYRPAVDKAKLSFAKRLKIKLGLDSLVEKTPEPIPKSQFKRIPNPHAGHVPGAPAQKMVLMSDKDGNAPWSDYIGENVGHELQRAERERSREERERLHQEAEQFAQRHEGRLDEDDRYKNRGGNNQSNQSGGNQVTNSGK